MKRSWTTLFPCAVACVLLCAATPQVHAQEPASSGLEVSEHGFGTAVVDRELQGRSDTFEQGGRVAFWTRVVGGQSGDRVYHVWFHEDREVALVELELGGPHWRTQSTKAMIPGSAGRWVVEVRDAADRLLARQEFVCVAPG